MTTTRTKISTRMRKKVNIERPLIAAAALLGIVFLCAPAVSRASAGQQSNGDQNSSSSQGSAAEPKETPQKNSKPQNKEKPYGVLFGTAYGPDDHAMHGVHVIIHPDGHKKPSWELMSDHRGEFAQRVPPGPGDYVITGEVEIYPVVDGKPQKSKKKRLTGQVKVHLGGEEQQDFSLHMNE
jgi:hypothetical protein